MFAQLPMYQRVGQAAYKKDLKNTLLLADELGNPETAFKSIHVAGTNGKGSVSHMLASVLQEAGYKVGLYTSPHLKDFRERIKINGNEISKKEVTAFIARHKTFFELHSLSFFEMTVGLAFDHFRREKVDIAIIEVGLGGRLDSTNIILPEVSVITNIGLDHTAFLGDTLPKIAYEKAGIIKSKIPVVIGESIESTKEVFLTVSNECNAPLVFAEDRPTPQFQSDLKGNYQKANIRTVDAVLEIMIDNGWNISKDNIKQGLEQVIRNTKFMGRWQTIGDKPKIICDTAHNREGLTIVIDQLARSEATTIHFVIGFVNDKDWKFLLSLFPKEQLYYFCSPNIQRGVEATTLLEAAQELNLNGKAYFSVTAALKAAKEMASEDEIIFVGGSTFVVAEVV